MAVTIVVSGLGEISYVVEDASAAIAVAQAKIVQEFIDSNEED